MGDATICMDDYTATMTISYYLFYGLYSMRDVAIGTVWFDLTGFFNDVLFVVQGYLPCSSLRCVSDLDS